MTLFQKAQRKKAKLRMALCSPSGGGKTHSALLIASGLTKGNIFVIDTEKGSSLLEHGKACIPEFYHAELTPPYSPSEYGQFISTAVQEGADCIIIDSLSSCWSGTGGLLDLKDQVTMADKNKNSWAAWRTVTPEHNSLVDAMIQCEAHLIVTMRTKTAWEVVTDDNGKKKPVKIGLKPVQREGLEYEFTMVMDLCQEGHIATVSKDRTSLFDGQHFVPSRETGLQLIEWLDNGIDPAIASAEKIETFKKDVDAVAEVVHLEEWYRNHQHEFSMLTNTHYKEMIAYCGQKKHALINGGNGKNNHNVLFN
jgi:hypothetical protein